MNVNARIIPHTVLTLALVCFCSQSMGADSQVRADPNGKTIAIALVDTHWTVEELDKLARNHVWGKSGPRVEEVSQTAVLILPREKKIMCEFTYSAGFAKPFWVVEIGYDGKVIRVRKGIKREG